MDESLSSRYLSATVNKRVAKTRTVTDALSGERWVRDISGSLSIPDLQQYISLWSQLQGVQLTPFADDKFIWHWSTNQQYSAASAYRAFFLGQNAVPEAKELSKTKAPPKYKFFIWLVLMGHRWTSSIIFGTAAHVHFALRRKNQSSTSCSAVYTLERCGSGSCALLVCNISPPCRMQPSQIGGASAGKGCLSNCERIFDTFVVLTSWCIWRERNNRVFNSAMRHAAQLASWIMDEEKCWKVAGSGTCLPNRSGACDLRGLMIFSPV
jgi:hypothetical protein